MFWQPRRWCRGKIRWRHNNRRINSTTCTLVRVGRAVLKITTIYFIYRRLVLQLYSGEPAVASLSISEAFVGLISKASISSRWHDLEVAKVQPNYCVRIVSKHNQVGVGTIDQWRQKRLEFLSCRYLAPGLSNNGVRRRILDPSKTEQIICFVFDREFDILVVICWRQLVSETLESVGHPPWMGHTSTERRE